MKNRLASSGLPVLAAFSAILLVVMPVSAGHQDEGGFGVQAGMGLPYGGNGLSAEYQIPLKEKIRLTPSIGLGVSQGGPVESPEIGIFWLNYSAGAFFEFGRTHRLFVGPHLFGSFDIDNTPESYRPPSTYILGPALTAGYKGVASFGLMWQVFISCAYVQDPLKKNSPWMFQPLPGFGLGYKF